MKTPNSHHVMFHFIVGFVFLISILFPSLVKGQECNIVQNGNFESVFNDCETSATIDDHVNNWTSAAGTADLFSRDCMLVAGSFNIENDFFYNGLSCDTWNDGADGNDHFIGFYGSENNNEAVQTTLVSDLVPGVYSYSFWAKIPDNFSSAQTEISGGTYQLVFCANDVQITDMGNFFDPSDLYQIENSINVTFLDDDCDWSLIQGTFTIPEGFPSGMNQFVIGYQQLDTSTSGQYVLIDDLKIEPPVPTIEVDGPLQVCSGSTLNLSPFVFPAGGTFSSPNVAGTIFNATNLNAGNYQVTYNYIDDFNCTTYETFTVQVLAAPVVLVNSDLNINSTYCAGTEFQLTATGATSYSWTPSVGLNNATGSQVIATPDVTTTYTVTGTNTVGCSDQTNITLLIFPAIQLSFDVDGVSCDQLTLGCIDLEVSGGVGEYQIEWTNVPLENSSFEDQCGLELGSYSVTVSDDNCSVTENVTMGFGYSAESIELNSNAETNALSNLVLSYSGMLIFNQNCDNAQITNSTFYFGPGAGVEIQEGAKVTFTNCHFLPCANNWLGINARSNTDDSTPRAELTLTGGSITGAWDAIKTKDEKPGSQQFFMGWRGALINAFDVDFINNYNAIDIRRAVDMNGGQFNFRFDECHFETNNDFFNHFNSYPQYQVYYLKMSGYGFRACSFINTTNTAGIDRWSRRGTAIYGNRARFAVREKVMGESYTPSTFRGFYRGVYATNYGTKNQGIDVRWCEFRQNKVAILTSGVLFNKISKNDIVVGELTGVIPLDNESGNFSSLNDNLYEGIAVRRGDFFEIAENDIVGTNIIQGQEFGITLRDTQTEDDEVYHNWLTNLDRGIQSDGDNAGATNLNGLRFICNRNQNNYYDFLVGDFVGPNQPAVAPLQEISGAGILDPDLPASNTFTQNMSILNNIDGHFRNDWGTIIHYLYRNSITPEIPTVVQDGEVGEDNAFDPNGTNQVNQCIEIYGDTYPGPEDWEEMPQIEDWEVISAATKVDYISNKLLYYSLLDEGNTDDLKYDVIDTWGEDVWEMRDRLLDASPYLSRIVLYEVADRAATYPHAIALEIFLANPDILRDRNFILHLETKADPMPAYMIEILLAAANQTTQRTIIEQNLGASRSVYIYYSQLAMRSRMYRPDYDELILLNRLDEWECLTCEYALIENEIDAGNTSGAQQRYAEIPMKINLGHTELRDYNQFDEWMNLRNTLTSSGRDWDALTETELTGLENLVDFYYTYAGLHAMEVLNAFYSADYYIPPSDGQGWTPRSARLGTAFVPEVLTLFPNPADYLVNVVVKAPVLPIGQQGSLVIYDVTGRMVETLTVQHAVQYITIDTRTWSPGMYLYELRLPNNPEYNGKFEIQH